MRGNVFFVEADSGQYIHTFVKELIEIRKSKKWDVVGEFNGKVIKVYADSTEDDLIKQYSA